jgi:hypothetical protein
MEAEVSIPRQTSFFGHCKNIDVFVDLRQNPGLGPIMSSPLQYDFSLSQGMQVVALTGGSSKKV